MRLFPTELRRVGPSRYFVRIETEAPDEAREFVFTVRGSGDEIRVVESPADFTEFLHRSPGPKSLLAAILAFDAAQGVEVSDQSDVAGPPPPAGRSSLSFGARSSAMSADPHRITVGQLRPLAVRLYAESRGWVSIPVEGERFWLFRHPEQRLRQLQIPMDVEDIGFVDAMHDVVRRIAEIERRSIDAVLADL